VRRRLLLVLGGVVAVSAGVVPVRSAARGQPAPGAADGAARPAKVRTLRLPETPDRYADVELPAHFKTAAVRRLDNTPSSNPVTDAGAALGRALFYDTRLSANNAVSCASCHQQRHAFSDPRKFSTGHEGRPTDRNAMPLVEVRYYARGRFFWDERAASLEDQVLMPVRNKVEMGQDVGRLVEIIAKDPNYPGLYRKAFGDPQVTRERTAMALAQFVRSLVSYRSRYDEGLAKARSRDDDFPNFTREENRGKAVFMRACASCHLPGGQDAAFTALAPLNTGLDADAKVADLGLADVTFNRFDAGRFKSPSLRNVEHTGPYMHDGRFQTLAEVVDHYGSGIKSHPNLDGRLRGPGRDRLRTSPGERAALVAFLKTLSDPAFLTDPKFSDPFEER